MALVLAFLIGPQAGALTLDQAIREAATTYQVDARVLTAIAHLESSGGKFTKLRANKNGTFDVGAFQINSTHWQTTCKMYNVHTLKENALCAARLLKMHKKFKGTDPHYLGRYHSRTPSKKVKYAKKIKAFLANSDK